MCDSYRRAQSHITPFFHTMERTMSAQSSLKAKAIAILDRVSQCAISAQNKNKSTCITQSAVIEKVRAWLIKINISESDIQTVLNRCRRDSDALEYFSKQVDGYACERRKDTALSLLEDYPDKQRAYCTETDPDTNDVVLTVAVRDKYSFEMKIPRKKYQPFLLAELIEKTTEH